MTSTSIPPASGPWLGQRALIVIVAAALLVALGIGMRQSFGLFMPAVSGELGGGREMFGLAIALQNLLWGLAQPGVGMLADRFGSRLVAACGGLVYALGLTVAALASSALVLNIGLGLMVGVGLSATAFVVVFGAVARVVPEARRGLAFGALAVLAAVMILLACGFPRGAPAAAPGPSGGSLGEALRSAATHRGYWLLNAGFFVCGFHVTFIATHLPAYLGDAGLSGPVAAGALALIGLFNVFGSLAFGMLGDRFAKPAVLSSLYAARVVALVVFLAVPLSPASALVFGAVIGFLWLGTVPLTSGLVGRIFGARYLGSLFGIVFLSHQLGSFAGAWLGGFVFDLTGGYAVVWWVAIALGVAATALHLPISERPLAAREAAA